MSPLRDGSPSVTECHQFTVELAELYHIIDSLGVGYLRPILPKVMTGKEVLLFTVSLRRLKKKVMEQITEEDKDA